MTAKLVCLVLLFTCHVALAQEGGTLRKTNALSTTPLHGHAFRCHWQDEPKVVVTIGFSGSREVYCISDGKLNRPCGHYNYVQEEEGGGGDLTGYSTATGFFQAKPPATKGLITSSFTSKEEGLSCHAVSLNWFNYSNDDNFMGLACPSYNTDSESTTTNKDSESESTTTTTTTIKHHFSFGLTGDVALRRTKTTNQTRTTTTDYYGIFQYNTNTQQVQMYFGPDTDQDSSSWRMSGFFRGDAFVPDSGTTVGCIHDGSSGIAFPQDFVSQLTQAAKTTSTTTSEEDAQHRDTWDSTVIAVGHASTTTAAAWGVGTTIFKSQPAIGLGVGWGLLQLADTVSRKYESSAGNKSNKVKASRTLKKGVMVQRMLCWAGSAVNVAAAATALVDTSFKGLDFVLAKAAAGKVPE